ncbi:MAG: DUF6582 domain-containing protein [Candidatus Limnocylindrales bacterium]
MPGDHLDDDQFAYTDKSGDRKLPIHDESHVRNAIARFSQTEFEAGDSKAAAARRILRAAKKHGVDVDDDDAVTKAAR